MLPTGTTHPGASTSDRNRNNESDGPTMSGGSSIDNRITMMEQRLIQNPTSRTATTPTLSLPIGSPSPTNRFTRTGSGGIGGSGPNRPTLPLHLPIVARTPRSELELKFQKIMEKSGLLKINDKIYRSQLSDLDRLGELGHGTSGDVVKMRHNPSGAIIAVKQMRRTGNDEENKRIIMDLDVVLKSENCKYIVKCLGCFITDEYVWICMELMTTCFDKLQKKCKTPVPEEILGKVTVATVRALAYLKDNHRVIHRDVKPSNILIDDRGNIKLCDFGISGRLVDSNAQTRSAGCAAYMAPERIDPAKTVYDIRADVWSLGITLVELATGVFPYRDCVTDFEVLTQVLTSNPPRLPEDQNFSIEFRDFVQRCLQKDYQARPKYPDLLRHAFLQRAERDTNINVSEWFREVAINCGIQLTSPPVPSGPSTSVASPPTWTTNASASSEQTRIPTPAAGNLTEVVQAQSNQQKQTIAIAASSIPIKSTATIFSQPQQITNETSPVSSHSQQQQQHRSQQQLQQQQHQILHSKLSNISLASSSSTAGIAPMAVAAAAPPPAPTSSYIRSSSSPGPYDPRRSPSPQAHYLAQMHQPKSAITAISIGNSSVPIATGGHGPALERNGSLLEPSGRSKYKHSPFLTRRTASEYGTTGSPKKESTLSSLGQSIFKNLTTSPFAQRKTADTKFVPVSPGPVMPVSSTMLYTNGGAIQPPPGSNPSSPLLLLRKAHDHHHHPGQEGDTQYKHLQGNTSPIVLQRFYHQQNQLIEQQREALQHQHGVYGNFSPSPVPPPTIAMGGDASPRATSRYSPLPSHRTVHHGVHPVLSVPPANTLHQSATPFYTHRETSPPVAPSGIPVYQHQHQHPIGNAKPHKPSSSSSFFHTFSRGMKSAGRGDKVIDRGGCPTASAERSLYGTANNQVLYHGQTSASVLHHRPLGIANGTGMMVPESNKEETGWFNSIADMAKRRFASFVKLNLSNSPGSGSGPGAGTTTTIGDKRTVKEKHLQQQQQQQIQLQQHYGGIPFDMPTGMVTATGTAPGGTMYVTAGSFPPGVNPASSVHPPSAIPPMAHVLNSSSADRRHRSPDPPPRLNRGQSPLLLQRKLEQLGHTGSPLVNRRQFTSTSPSPPLPPRRGSESVPGSPQHLRARINYTPEPHRRPYRTTIDQ